MIYLLDNDALLALVHLEHDNHARVHRWFQHVTQFATCPFTQAGFLRISTSPAFPHRVSMESAWRALDQITKFPGHQFIPANIDLSQSLDRKSIRSHADITDGYLARLAQEIKGALATLDQAAAKRFASVHLIGA